MTESREKGYFDAHKWIIEVENIFWDMHKSPHICYEVGLAAFFGDIILLRFFI
jgi:hypothetical protein